MEGGCVAISQGSLLFARKARPQPGGSGLPTQLTCAFYDEWRVAKCESCVKFTLVVTEGILRPIGFILACAAISCGMAHGQSAQAEVIEWKPVVNAVLKVDDRPAKIWDLYVTGKRKHLALVQLGARFLMLDLEAQQISELAEPSLTRKGANLHWREGDQQTLLPSEDWSQKTAGRAKIVRLLITREGRRLEVQLPIAPDLRKFY